MSSGKDIIANAKAKREYKKSVQEMMDEKMCRPGYRWLGEPLNKCVPAAVPNQRGNGQLPGVPSETPQPQPQPTPEQPSADQAVAAEASARKQSKGKG